MEQPTYRKSNVGVETWSLDNKGPHREDGPAAVYPNGDTAWYFNGVLHREDGPAVEFRYVGITAAEKDLFQPPRIEWWYHGKRLPVKTQQEFEQYMRMKVFW
jgi:hypothetical protein